MLQIPEVDHHQIRSTLRMRLLSPVLAVLLVTIFSVPPTTLAQVNSSPHQEILNLLKSNNTADAYQLALSYLPEWEGELKFDFAYGLVAKAAGHLDHAVYSFERVLEQTPKSEQVRYFLAVTYFEMGNFVAAKKQFELLQQSLIQQQLADSDYHQQSQQYLNVISRKSKKAHWNNWLQLSLGFDDNANNGIKDEFITVPVLGSVRLFEQSLEIESAYTDAQLQFMYVKPQDQLSAWYAGVDARHLTFNDSLAWSRTFFRAMAGYKNRWQQLDWDINIFYRPLLLDNHAYLHYTGLSTNASYLINKITNLGLTLTYAQEQYYQLAELDKDQSIASLWLAYKSAPSVNHRFELRYAKEQTDNKANAYNDRDLWGASYLAKWAINNKWIIHGKLDYLNATHQGVTPLFLIKRQDKLSRAEVQLEHRFIAKWSALLKLNHLRNSSNTPLYDYDRNTLSMAIRYSF